MIAVVTDRDPEATRVILESLPDWFADSEAIDNYVADAVSDQFVSLIAVTTESGSACTVGVAQIERHFPESAELHLIAVSPGVRGKGVGRALVERAAADLAGDGCVMLTVHTVGPSFDHEPYAQTRAFYRALGFLPVEEHENLDWPGPTVIMVRPLHGQV
ncbi:GNAT family N-acetyltransferase [Ruania halotolerans]|uniref:GNAT family N-acetyltransferase n=1 Tax=Ruania halotolerans TaxID=2897773 RepID=UPI001E33FA60|nr:GNAT family N-acetyltransferase [Ruania halotolerans]UFU07778.1 GNAT family N-acetyltransferase [Ruania halotolerans]